MTLTWRILLSVPFWLLRLAVFLPLAILGIPLVYLLAWAEWHAPRYSSRFKRIVLQWRTPWLLYLFSNQEDGIDGLRGGDPNQQWWADKTASADTVWRIFEWSAMRNPVDNLRFVPLLNLRIDPAKVRFLGMDHEPAKGEGGWYFAWHGVYSCIRYETRSFRFWLGWKLKPEDSKGLPSNDARAICDFACQFKRVARAEERDE